MLTSVLRSSAAGLLATFVAAPAGAQPVLKQEPPRGSLRSGEVALVDNGRCPRGQLLEVTGGHLGQGHSARGGGGASQPRQYRCVPRP